MISEKLYKMKRRTPGYFSSMERIRVNLHTQQNNLQRNSKQFDFVFVFLALDTSCWIKTLQYFLESKQFTR